MKIRGLGFAWVLTSLIFSAGAAEGADRQFYELRVYATQNEKQQGEINGYWEKAAIPAYHRAGIGPIGVFTETKDSETNRIICVDSTWFDRFVRRNGGAVGGGCGLPGGGGGVHESIEE